MSLKPVMVILRTIQHCREFKRKLSSTGVYIFDAESGDAVNALGILKEI